MKKTLLLISAGLIGLSALAQQTVKPEELKQTYAIKISPNGRYVAIQDISGSAGLVDTENKYAISWYPAIAPGVGNCVSDNGIMVGDKEFKATIMYNGAAYVPKILEEYSLSVLNGITPDGKRATGYLDNTGNAGATNVPFICNLDENAQVIDLVKLPVPTKDFLGTRPQFITGLYISDDGKTVIGQMMDDTGFYLVPIYFKEDEAGNWSYVEPTRSIFNPDKLPIPSFPTFSGKDPQVTDFMDNAEDRAIWTAAMEAYENNTGPNPWVNWEKYMTQAQYDAYQEAQKEYRQQVAAFYAEIDKYWEQLAKVTHGSGFALGTYVLSPDGSTYATCGMIVDDSEGVSDIAEAYVLYLINTNDGTFRTVKSEKYPMIVPTQILPDGTVICIDRVYYSDYVLLPGADDFIPFSEYLMTVHPSWLPWMESNLSTPTDNGVELMAGIISFSNDLNVMAGGMLLSEMEVYSYVFKNDPAGVDSIISDITGKTVVYDLQGRKVLETENADDIRTLGKGIYVVNGKKVAL